MSHNIAKFYVNRETMAIHFSSIFIFYANDETTIDYKFIIIVALAACNSKSFESIKM